ncbi:MAG TPA: hypothetical protein VGD12_08700 [Blastococcus sp.]|jgi:hypothetical protein
MTAPVTVRRTTGWFTADDCRLDDFRAIVETTTDPTDHPCRRDAANLLQVSSAVGRAMETVDRSAMWRALSPFPQAQRRGSGLCSPRRR